MSVTEEITARQELEEVLGAYREADTQEKSAKKEKDDMRPAVLDLFTEVIDTETQLLRETVEVSADELEPDLGAGEALEKWRLTHYPEYVIARYVVHENGVSVSIEEDPSRKKFDLVVDGYTFGRTYAMVGASVDGEGLHEFSLDAQDFPFRDAIKVDTITTYTVDEKKLRAIVSDNPALLKAAQRYINPGQVQVRLAPIRKAKEEDLT